MPLIIPKELPAYGELSRENVFVMHQQRAQTQQIRPLRILILNLMPTKIVTETQLARLLANSPLQVQLTFLQTKTHDTTHTPQEHMKAFYKTFDAVRNERFDGMIITGAPIEDLDYEDVDYWNELCEIMDSSVLGCAGRAVLPLRRAQGTPARKNVRRVRAPRGAALQSAGARL